MTAEQELIAVVSRAENSSSEFRFPRLSELRSGLTGLFLSLSPVAYVCGFSVANFYYLGRGVSGANQLRFEYLLTGTTFLFVTLSNWALFAGLSYFRAQSDVPSGGLKRYKRYLLAPTFSLAHLVGTPVIIDYLTLSHLSKWATESVPISCFTVYFALSFLMYRLALFFYREIASIESPGIDRRVIPLLLTHAPTYVLTLFTLAVVSYAITIFPNTSSFLAGGEPMLGTVYLAKDANTTAKSGKEYPIVFRNEKSVFLQDDGLGRVTEVKADKVESINFAPLSPFWVRKRATPAVIVPTVGLTPSH